MKKIIAVLIAVCLLFTLSVTAFAAKSPIAQKVHKASVVDGKSGVISDSTVEDGSTVTITANPENGTFTSWTIYKANGKAEAVAGVDYIITSGSLTGSPIVITPLADIIICANYDGKITDPSVAVKGDGSSTAPQTADISYIVFAVIMLASLACGFAAKKSLAK